ncbi:hypothetical protein QNH39_13145 [Neobacillus novalis]|uniref:Uncharacterized protein n=1 Tax=Neobacillus novalis TaxID=220687 RepID=A0AA95MR00_9BACI|nr:hypothetical protein [Neobacillus novalis]WHY88717.1 hypothetical protein QNH39_13145 [Neobacillus novalis]
MIINKTIFKGKVYYSVADLAELFGVSPYKMRKAIKDQKIKTKNNIFGRTVFVLEENVAKINVYGTMKILVTQAELITADPVKETKVVEFSKPKRKNKKRKKSAKKKEIVAEEVKTESVVEEKTQVAPVEEQEGERATLVEKIKEHRLQYVKDCRSQAYEEIYMEFMGDEIPLEKTTPEHNEQLKLTAEMLELEFEESNENANFSNPFYEQTFNF